MSRESAQLKIVGKETADNTVPVDVLIRALQGMQQTALILAASVEKKAVQQRFRPSEELRQRCTLRCGPLSGGSVEVAMSIEEEELLRFPDAPQEHLMGRLLRFTAAVASADEETLGKIIPDSRFRSRALRETLNYLPGAGQRWSLELANGTNKSILLDTRTRTAIETWFRASDSEAMVITGQLTQLDFESNRVVVRYPPTKKHISCSYEVDAEDALIQSRRDLVQVHGRFDLDDDGNPRRAIDVTRIEPLDLSPMTFDSIRRGDRVLHFDPPLTVTPVPEEETSQLLIVEEPSIDLHAFARTREELEQEVSGQLLMLWDEYGKEKPEKLTKTALKVQEALKQRIKETKHGKVQDSR
jgi:hypothetical protein